MTNDKNLKLITEYGPIIIFFIVYLEYGIFDATLALIISSIVVVPYAYFRTKKIPTMNIVVAVMVTFFGGLTYYLKDPLFIMVKPTIVNLIFGIICFGSVYFNKLFLKSLLGSTLKLDTNDYKKFTINLGIYFVLMAGLNELIWRNFAEQTWVYFKLFGSFGFMILFLLSQYKILKKGFDE